MILGPAGPVWGRPSVASSASVPLRTSVSAAGAAYRAEGGSSPYFGVMAASVAGVSHRLAARCNEDAFAWHVLGEARLGLAVADGVSSAGRGGEGAELAVAAATHWLACHEGEDGDLCRGAVRSANERLLMARAPQAGAAPELCTTLTVAVAVRAPGGGWTASLARVGDSTAFALRSGGRWEELFACGAGDGTSTDAIPSARADGVAVEVAPPVAMSSEEVLVLMTDGVANPLRDGPSTVAPALGGLTGAAAAGALSPAELLFHLDFSRRGSHDDRTVVMVWLPAAV